MSFMNCIISCCICWLNASYSVDITTWYVCCAWTSAALTPYFFPNGKDFGMAPVPPTDWWPLASLGLPLLIPSGICSLSDSMPSGADIFSNFSSHDLLPTKLLAESYLLVPYSEWTSKLSLIFFRFEFYPYHYLTYPNSFLSYICFFLLLQLFIVLTNFSLLYFSS